MLIPQAIEVCPQNKEQDLSTFHQNRAAAYEQLVNLKKNIFDNLLQFFEFYIFTEKSWSCD